MLQFMPPAWPRGRLLGDNRLTRMDERSRRVQWPAARATPQHAADLELNEKGRHWGGQPFLAYGRLAKPFTSEKEENGFDPPVSPASERPAPYPCPMELCPHRRATRRQEPATNLQHRTF